MGLPVLLGGGCSPPPPSLCFAAGKPISPPSGSRPVQSQLHRLSMVRALCNRRCYCIRGFAVVAAASPPSIETLPRFGGAFSCGSSAERANYLGSVLRSAGLPLLST